MLNFVKEIIYGTTNPAKLAQIRDIVESSGFTVRGLADLNVAINIDESGETAEENARLKALGYTAAIHRSVLAMDVGLYFNDLPEDEQPGLHVRRINKSDRATDEELIAYYTS